MRLVLISVILALGLPARAAIVEQPLPDNAYISIDGLDWAWASPCAAGTTLESDPNIECGFDLTYQSQFGWHLPTADEFALAPNRTEFVFAGANVPRFGYSPEGTYSSTDPGGDLACASAYFNTDRNTCDWIDKQFSPWANRDMLSGRYGGPEFGYETLVVRISAVPIPAAVWLFGSALAALGWRKRK